MLYLKKIIEKENKSKKGPKDRGSNNNLRVFGNGNLKTSKFTFNSRHLPEENNISDTYKDLMLSGDSISRLVNFDQDKIPSPNPKKVNYARINSNRSRYVSIRFSLKSVY